MECCNSVEFCVYGDFALITDPLTKVGGEKTSYQVPTYEVIKNICKSIYWKPTFLWVVDEIRVMNQINMESHGVKLVKYHRDTMHGQTDIANYTYLTNVKYQVKAHIEWNKNRPEFIPDRNLEKHLNQAKRNIKKGGRRDIFIGTRECQAYVEPCVFGSDEGAYDNVNTLSFGHMVHGITYPDEAYSEDTKNMVTVNFWNAVMHNGVIKFPLPSECPTHKKLYHKKPKQFKNREEGETNGAV